MVGATEPGSPSAQTPSIGRVQLLRLLDEQERLLLAIATGVRRSADLDREYALRGQVLRAGLAALGLNDPFPYWDLGAWVAECSLRIPTADQQRAVIARHVAPVRAVLAVPAG